MAQPKARNIDTIDADGFTVDGRRFDLGDLSRTELLRLSSRFGLGIDSRSKSEDLRSGVTEAIRSRTADGSTIDVGGFGRRSETDEDTGAESERFDGSDDHGAEGAEGYGKASDGNGSEGDGDDGEGDGEGAEGDGSDGSEGSDGDGAEQGDGGAEGDEAEGAEDQAPEVPEVPDHFGQAVVDAIARRATEVRAIVGTGGGQQGERGDGFGRPEPRPRPEPRDFDEVAHRCLPEVLDVLEVNLRGAYLVGPAGTGKSYIAQQCSRILGVPFASLSCGQLPQDYKLEGYPDRNGWAVSDFVRLFDSRNEGGVFCLDEIDNSHPATLTVLNTALSNGYLFVNGERIDRHPDFRVVATANTYGSGPDAQYVGRSALDFATVNRFRRIEVGFDTNVERAQCERVAHEHGLSADALARWISTWAALRDNIDAAGFQITATSRGLTEGVALLARGWSAAKIIRSEFAEVNASAYERITSGLPL